MSLIKLFNNDGNYILMALTAAGICYDAKEVEYCDEILC